MKYFGTDGIRGTYGDVEICEPFFYALGRAAAEYLNEAFPGNNYAVVGGDTRASTDTLKEAFVRGVTDGGARCEDVGVLPTPALAYCVMADGDDVYVGGYVQPEGNPQGGIACIWKNGQMQSLTDGSTIAKVNAL